MTPEKAARPEHIEADPRTDGVGDGGENELDPPTDEEIAAGAEHDRSLRRSYGVADRADYQAEDG